MGESWNGIRLTGLIPYIGVGAQQSPTTKDYCVLVRTMTVRMSLETTHQAAEAAAALDAVSLAPQSRGTVS